MIDCGLLAVAGSLYPTSTGRLTCYYVVVSVRLEMILNFQYHQKIANANANANANAIDVP